MSWPWVFFLHQFICNPFQSNLCNESVTAETETDWAEVQVILNIIMIFHRNYSNRNTTRSYHLDSHHLFLSKYINGMWIEQKCHRNKRNYHQNIFNNPIETRLNKQSWKQGVRERARVPQLVMLCCRWAHLQCFTGRTLL